ncbi:Segregation and condensation protein B [Planctopirus ephydatiae]|uniref:Segregation and condensation protein B n=1 Tax=Planctopirus ephydatiae TaxID=2528019 RepID=A0A518GST8_9PLAN|nr:SMC-Scp complex subunit ScpB [Planctopirus ephydatiae]QDV31651.1 Segregation and condensation protein B [Planctopirus ephydatiae]
MSSFPDNPEEEEKPDTASDAIIDEPTWDVDDLEAAYRLALEACEAAEEAYSQQPIDELASGVVSPVDPITRSSQSMLNHSQVAIEQDVFTSSENRVTDAFVDTHVDKMAPAEINPSAATPPAKASPTTSHEPTVRSVIEACLFVGEPAVTIARLREILRNDITDQRIELAIGEVKRMYDDQQRPYEVTHQEGVYRLSLRAEFEKLRAKTYGQGPKEIKLSQEAIEVLSVVAYHQPIEEREVNEIYEIPSGGILKQLLRRELLAVQLDAESPKVVRYVTTPRFLKLFQLRRLADLPRAETFAFK